MENNIEETTTGGVEIETNKQEKQKVPYTSMKNNIISGTINGYMISGLVYNDARMIISIPVLDEVDDETLQAIERPRYIKDIRYYNGRVDFLSDIVMFNVYEGEAVLEDTINKLIELDIKPNLEYVEERVEPIYNYNAKAALIFIVDILIGALASALVFRFQLGQLVGNSEGVYYLYYSVPVVLGFLPLFIYSVNEWLFTRLKMVNRYEKESIKRTEILNMSFNISTAILSQIIFIIYNSVYVLENTLVDTFRYFVELVIFFFTYDPKAGSMFFLNIICLVIGLAIAIGISIKVLKRAKNK